MTIADEIDQAKAELAACEQALDYAQGAFVAVAVLRLSAARAVECPVCGGERGDGGVSEYKLVSKIHLPSLPAIPVGSKLTLTIPALDGLRKIQGYLAVGITQEGYIDGTSGAWVLYGDPKRDIPSYRIWLKPRGKKKARGYRVGFNCINVEHGWLGGDDQ